MLTLGQAAKAARTSKTTLSRAIKAGRLSATRRDDGSYAIDPAELSRVFTVTPDTGTATGNVVQHATPPETPSVTPDAVLTTELDGARKLIALLEAQLTDVKADRDVWRQQAERATLALTAPTRPWWRRLAG